MAKVTDEQRQQIAALCAQGVARNEIARRVGCSAGSVTNVARSIDHAFDRAATQNATAAGLADNRARRALLASNLLDDADRMRREAQYADSAKDKQHLFVCLGIALDKSMALEKFDARDDGQAKGLLEQLVESMAGRS